MPHQTDSPDLSGQGPQPGSDFDAVVLEQLPSHFRLVDARRYGNRIQHGQAARAVDWQRQAERLQLRRQVLVHLLMASKYLL